MTEQLLKPQEVCQTLGISYGTLMTLLQEHAIGGYKVGGQWRFAQADVDAYIQRCRVASRPASRPEPCVKRGRPVKYGCGYVPGMKVV